MCPTRQVAIGSNKAKFSSAVGPAGRISVSGTVKSGTPFLTRIGSFDVDLAIEVGGAGTGAFLCVCAGVG